MKETDVSLAAAAAREVKEEVGLDFVPTEKFGFYETNTEEHRIIGFVYLGEWTGEVVPLASEVADVGWFGYGETKNLDLAFSYGETIDDLYERGLIR